MKLQTKLIFSILPLLIGTILALTFWATNTTEKRIRESEYVHMSTVLNYYFEEMLEKPYMLLQKNGLENIQSFIEGYQTNALESIRDKYVVPSGSFLILDDFGKVLYNGKKDTYEVDVESAYVLLLTEIQGVDTEILRGHLQNEYFHDAYVYKRFAQWKWNIFVVKNDSVIHDTVRSINRGALGIGLVSSAFCLLFIIILIKRFIIRPINMLKNVAEKIALREPVPPWPIIRKDELGVLAGSIQQMSEEVSAYQAKLLSLQDKLEDQVRVRT